MADFCKQCATNLFGEDPAFNDARGLITEADSSIGLAGLFLCEGCGSTMVDHEGKCITDCLEHHGSI